MPPPGTSAPAWLFSFVDLAFLLLIAMTQLGSQDMLPDLGQVRVPKLHTDASAAMPSDAGVRWQLRVHPRASDDEAPFELFAGDADFDADGEATPADRLDLAALERRLAELRDAAAQRPLLAPHRTSRSEDLLAAATALEDVWPGRRRAAFEPQVAAR